MARRRLLTILAASAVLGAAVTGPAAAADLAGTTQDPVSEAATETVEAGDAGQVGETGADAVEATAQAVGDAVESVAPEPVAEVDDTVEQAVTPEPSPSAEPTTDDSSPAASTSGDDDAERVVAAGDVTAAPSLAFLTGTGGSAPAAQSRSDLTPPPMPTVTSAPRTDEGIEAPQVAPAPAAAADTSAPSALAQSVRRAVDEEGTPIMVLVAIASLLAAGVGTVHGARSATA